MTKEANETLMQLSCPEELHVLLRRMKLDREIAGQRRLDGKKEKLENVLIFLAEEGVKSLGIKLKYKKK